MRTLHGSDWCWTHDPEKAEQRAAARLKGGQNRRTPSRSTAAAPQSLRDVESIQQGIEYVWLETLEQENSAQRSGRWRSWQKRLRCSIRNDSRNGWPPSSRRRART
jgi:hypothetical protein